MNPFVGRAQDFSHNLSTQGTLTATSGNDNYFVTTDGTSTANRIIVESGYTGTIRLTGVEISSAAHPIEIQAGAHPTIIISGNNVLTATGSGNAGLFVAQNASVTIDSIDGNNTSNSLTGTGADNAAGIGGGSSLHAGDITIKNITVNATGGIGAAAIGGGQYASVGKITLENCITTATGGNPNGGYRAAAIGGGGTANAANPRAAGDIMITGGSVHATSGTSGTAIGGGNNSPVGTITIKGCSSVMAISKGYGAGIGAGFQGSVAGDIILQGNGDITATADIYGSGIGGTTTSTISGSIRIIDNGNIIAQSTDSGNGGSGIGTGCQSSMAGDIVITGNKDVTATSAMHGSGIGGGFQSTLAGSITVSGNDDIIATAGRYGSGIGGGYSGSVGDIFLEKNGNITASSAMDGAGIGGSYESVSSNGNITITGNGTVKATGGANCAGIGGGDVYGKDATLGSANIVINNPDGKVIAEGGYKAAGIGGSHVRSLGNITIRNTIVEAIGQNGSAGIGGGIYARVGDITLIDCDITAVGGNQDGGYRAAAIGGGGAPGSALARSTGNITITGGSVMATSGDQGAGIGSGNDSPVGTITITGCSSVTAISKGYGSAIGGGYGSMSTGDIILTGNGDITATSAGYGSGIGGGYGTATVVGDITLIDNGVVTATAGSFGTAIGGGYGTNSAAGHILLDGNTRVDATANHYGEGIGSGSYGTVKSITILSGTVNASVNTAAGGAGSGIGWSDKPGGVINILGGTVTASGSYSIGGGNGGTIVVLPGAEVNATGSIGYATDIYYLSKNMVGTVGTNSFVATPAFTARTYDYKNGADVYADLSDFSFTDAALSSGLLDDLDKVYLGTTSGVDKVDAVLDSLHYYSSREVRYYTDAINDGSNLQYLPDTLKIINTSNYAAQEVVFDYSRWELESYENPMPVTPTSADILKDIDMGAYTFGTTPALNETFTLFSAGNQDLEEFSYSITMNNSSDPMAFELTGLPTATVAPADKTVITVKPAAGLPAGIYEGELTITAHGLKASGDDGHKAETTITLKVEVLKNMTAAGGLLTTGIPDGAYTNADKMAMTATPDSGNAVEYVEYAFTNSITDPGPPYSGGRFSAGTVTVDVPVTSSENLPAEGEWYLHWYMCTSNTESIGAPVRGPYYIDRTAPTAEFQSVPGGTVADSFTVDIQFKDDGGVIQSGFASSFPLTTLDNTHLDVVNGSIGTVTDNGGGSFRVQIIPNSGLTAGTAISITIKENILTDVAGNPNEKSQTAQVIFDASKPSADFSGFDGTVYPAAQTGFTFTVDSNYSADSKLYLKDGTEITTNAQAASVLRITNLDTSASVPFTVVYTAPTATDPATFTVSGSFGEGLYEVIIDKDEIRNGGDNGIAETPGEFAVRIPSVLGVTASETTLDYNGKAVTFTVTTKNVQVNLEYGNNITLDLERTPASPVSKPSLTSGMTITRDQADVYTITLVVPDNVNEYWTQAMYDYVARLLVNGGLVDDSKSVRVTVDVEPLFTLTSQNDTSATSPLTYGYGSADITTAQTQTITIKNEGNQPLDSFTATLTGSDVTSFDLDSTLLSGLTLDVGDTVTVVVTPKLGLKAGSYNASVAFTAKGTGSFATENATTSANLAEQVVDRDITGPTGGTFTTDPMPTLYTNANTIEMRANPGAGNTLVELRYIFTADATQPVNFTGANSGSFTSSSSTEDLPGEGQWYLHWYMVTDNTEGYGGYLNTYHIDRTRPTAEISPDPYPGTVNGPFKVTVQVKDASSLTYNAGLKPFVLQASHLDIQNGSTTDGDITDQGGGVFEVEIAPDVGLTTGNAITVQVKAGVVEDLAGNTNLVSNKTEATYNNNAPSADFSSFAGKVYPVERSSLSFTVSSGYTSGDLFLSNGTTPVTSANAGSVFAITAVNGGPVPGYTVTYTLGQPGTFAINAPGGFPEGEYRVNIDAGDIVNAGKNHIETSSANFQVRIPSITDLTAGTNSMTYEGGNVVLTIKGANLHVNESNGVKVGVREAADAATTWATYSHSDATHDYYTVTVTVPQNNSTTATQSYTYTAWLDNSATEAASTHQQTIVVDTMPNLSYNAGPDPLDLGSLTYGYTLAQANGQAGTVTITNDGNRNLSGFGATLSNGNFVFVTQPAGGDVVTANGGTLPFDIRPATGLGAGTHSAVLTITQPDTAPVSITVTFAVTQSSLNDGVTMTANPLPDAAHKNHTQVTLTPAPRHSGDSVTSWAYAITNSNGTPSPGDWVSVPDGNPKTVSFPGADGTYYLHWTAETAFTTGNSGIIDNGSSVQTYLLDRTKPTISLARVGSTPTINGPFQVTITITEPNPATASGFAPTVVPTLNVTRGTASAPTITAGGTGSYSATFTVTPSGITSGQDVIVTASGVFDLAGNAADSDTLAVPYNDDRPTVSFGGLPAGGVSTTVHSSFTITASETMYTSYPTEASDTDFASLLTITRDGSPFTTFTVSKSGNTFTVTGPFDEGAYVVSVRGDSGSLENANNNWLVGNSASFQVRIPEIFGISATPSSWAQGGGTSLITVTGKNLHLASSVRVDIDGGTPQTAQVNPAGTQATYAAVIPANWSILPFTHTATAWLDSTRTTFSDTIMVAPALPNATGLTADPGWFNYEAGQTRLTVSGTNLHNYQGLRVVEYKDGVITGNEFFFTGLSNGATEATYLVPLQPNATLVDEVYTYELAADSPAITGIDATVTVEAANPVLGGGGGSSALSADPDSFDRDGGTTTLTIRGENLHNYNPFEIHDTDRGDVYPIALSDISSDYRTASIQITLPVNPNLDDELYEFELYTGVASASPPIAPSLSGDTATITVEGSKPKVTGVTANPNRLTSEGGDSTFTIEGKYLDNAFPLELVDSLGGTHVVTDIAPDGSSATITIHFNGNTGPRNDIHELEAYIAGDPTGESDAVEVGDSNPYVDGAYATPESLSVNETLNSAGRSVITVTGGYLYEFDSIQLYDEVNDKWYDVAAREPDDDTEADCAVSITSNEGTYTFQVWADGEYTGYDAHVYVGVSPGHVNPEPDENEVPRNPDDKEWAGRGGGHKGQGFTGDYGGFDFLFHHARQAVLQDGDNAAITLQNVWYIAKSQLDYASSGARDADWRNGRVKLQFDTTMPGTTDQLEGRLILDPFEVKHSVYPTICTCEDETARTRHLFQERYGAENLAVVRLMQPDSFGARVEVLANVNLEGMDTGSLSIYRYDRETGSFGKVSNPDYSIDSNGFLRFFTTEGGDYVVTGAPLTDGGAVVASGQLQPDVTLDRRDEEEGEE